MAQLLEGSHPGSAGGPRFEVGGEPDFVDLAAYLVRMGVSDREALELVARHAAGDFGQFRDYESGRAGLNAESRWASALPMAEVRNALTLEAGSGLVVSPHDVHRTRIDRRTCHRGPERRGRVATLLAPGEPSRTVVYLSLDRDVRPSTERTPMSLEDLLTAAKVDVSPEHVADARATIKARIDLAVAQVHPRGGLGLGGPAGRGPHRQPRARTRRRRAGQAGRPAGHPEDPWHVLRRPEF